MESWNQVIIEWINCLGICKQTITHIQQLQDNELFYSKIIKQLKQNDCHEIIDDTVQICKFIKDEYPEIVITNNDNANNELEHVYFTSLLLLSASQKMSFHRPMYSLKNETQVLIKRFLELVLPYGKTITLDTIHDTILELNDVTPVTPPQTPKDRPLKNFLNSPAAHSAYRHKIMNERTRELRLLKAQLETEKFEKADMQEDLKLLEDKIKNLQDKLKYKTEELRALRMERTLKATPKSTKKNYNKSNIEEHMRKELEHMKLFNGKLQSDLDNLESKHENLTRRLTSKERINTSLKQKVDEYERDMETLSIQLEIKTNELLDLRMQNEELRAHIKGIQKRPVDAEQSFEIDNVSRARSPTHELNISEVASSIIDIQLRESHEESTRLKAELNNIQVKLDAALDQCNELKIQNELFNEKILMLDQVEMTLEITEDKLSKRDCQINIIEMERQSLHDEIKKLQNSINEKEIILKNTVIKASELELDKCNLQKKLNELNISLVMAQDTLEQIVTTKEVLNMKLLNCEEKIGFMEKSLAEKTKECDDVKELSQNKIHELEQNIAACMNDKRQVDETLVQKNNDYQHIINELTNKNSIIDSLQSDISQLENKLSLCQSSLAEKDIKLCELNELKDELQSQLAQERDNATTLSTNKCELEFNLSAAEAANDKFSHEFSALQSNFNELQRKYDDLCDKIKLSDVKYIDEKDKADALYSKNAKLTAELIDVNAEISQLKNIQENLQNRLIQEQECCVKLVTEKADMERIIAINERKNNDQSDKISMLQSIIDKSHVELEHIHSKYTEANVKIDKLIATVDEKNCELDELNGKILKLNEINNDLTSELEIIQNDAETCQAEKIALEIALLSRDDDKKNLTIKITSLEAELDESRKDIQKLNNNYETLLEKYDSDTQKIILLNKEVEALEIKCKMTICERNTLQNKVNDMAKELNAREIEFKEMQLQINEQRGIKERMMDSHQDHQNASNELIGSLEKKLLTTQNTCESLKLDMKLQEESVKVLTLKLEEVTNKKIESELKMKEVIAGFEEVRSSQEALLETQANALADKTSEFDVFKIKYLNMETELQAELDIQKTHNVELLKQCITLQDIIDKHIKEIEELKQTRDDDDCRLKELRDKLESMEKDMKIIVDIYEILMRKNHQQDDKLELERLFNCFTTMTLPEMLKNVCNRVETADKLTLELQEENNNLKKNLEDEKTITSTEEKKMNELLDQLNFINTELNKRNIFLIDLIKKKDDLLALSKETIARRNELEENLSRVRESWNVTSCDVTKYIAINSSACDELKHIEAQRTELEEMLNDINDRYSNNLKPLMKILSQIFTWSDNKIYQLYTVPLNEMKLDMTEIDLTDEISVLEAEIEINEAMLKELIVIEDKIDKVRCAINSYEINIKSGIIKREVTAEEKLQIELEKMIKERKELKDKMDSMRVRNAKMEKNMDELRSENKKIKIELSELSSKYNIELERLTTEINQLLKNIDSLNKEKIELEKRLKEADFDIRLKDIHDKYGEKLEMIKQKMNVAYSEQIAKLKAEQDKIMADKVASMRAKMEQQCKKYSDDIAKYKAHISDMSSQFWDVGEKLLAEKQEKEIAIQHLRELKKKYQTTMNDVNQSIQSTSSQNQIQSTNIDREYNNYDRINVPTRSNYRAIQVIEEQTTTTRRHSVKSIQAMGNAFNAEDEEGEVFDNVYLADLKEGKFRNIEPAIDFDRMSELRMRNSLCRPHLKSSYAVETHLHPLGLTEEDIKNGPPNDDTFNDSLSQSLLPSQKTKKKDRTQTSYKRPGPPTPSKNGGRLSLQGNELKSPNSRILRERNSERRTTATPKRLKDFFATSLSRRQDENAPATPKGRRLSNIFRKTRPTDKN